MKKIDWTLPDDLGSKPRWRDVPVLLYNIWAALDDIADTSRRAEKTAERINRAASKGYRRGAA
jgi:hypothetical protein